MRKSIICLGLLGIIAGKAQANCDFAAAGGVSQSPVLTIPDQTITIDADLAASKDVPFATFDSNEPGYKIAYENCMVGTAFGRSAPALGTPVGDGLYKTNIDGILVKPLWSPDRSSWLGFPRIDAFNESDVDPDSHLVSLEFQANTGFRLEFYKTSDSLKLSNTSGDTLLAAQGILAYYWMVADTTSNPANAAQTLKSGLIKIISTPSCTHTANQTVDFGLVSSATLTAGGVKKDLPFEITCRTDYGDYSVTAAISTTTPSDDSTYIKVKDAGNNDDRMGIKIQDSKGNDMKVDGSTNEKISNKASTTPAKFAWTATLIPVSTTHPTNGDFSAHAEITLQLR